MARDVDFNLTASDKTGPALSAAERKFRDTQNKIKKDGEDAFGGLGKGIISLANKVGPKFGAEVTKGLSQAASAGGPLLAGIGIAAAPFIAGTLSAAIIGGAGIGGVLGGVALAARDPRVKAAGKVLGDNMLSDLTDFARPFIAPVLAGIGDIDRGFDAVGGNLRNIFANASRYVAPLTKGVIAFGQGLVRGFDVLVSKAGPVINAISAGFTQAGTDVERFFTQIAGGADGAAVAVRGIFDLFSGFLAVAGPVIAGLTKINGWLDKIGANQGLLQVIGKLRQTGTMSSAVAGEQGNLATAVNTTNSAAVQQAATMEALNATYRRQTQEAVSLFGAETQAAQAIRDATTAIKNNGAGIDSNTKKGRENRVALTNLATALNTNYDAYVKVNGAGAAADGVMRRNRDAFIKAAGGAGIAAGEARRLADRLIGIPAKRAPKVELIDKASGKINNVINRLGAVKSKTVSVNVLVRQSGDAAALRKQNLPAFSARGHFAAVTGEAGRSRTGGPSPVNVNQSLSVSLDGQPFYDYTARAVREGQSRAEWRRKVGTK